MRLQPGESTWFRVFCLALLVVCGLGAPVLALDAPHNATNSIGCNNCHATHGLFGIMPRGQLQSDQCKTCHKPDGQASSMANVGDHMHGNAVTDYGVDCGACHDPHSAMTSTDAHNGDLEAANLSLLRSDPKKYVPAALDQLVFQTKPDHFAFDSGPYNAVCQTCHTDVTTRPTTPWHKNDGTGVAHNFGTSCTGCHPHGSSFRASGGSCKSCHSTPRGTDGHRRQIVQDGGTGGDFSGSGGGPTTSTVRDEFASVSYANNDGSATWVANWVDSEDTDPAAGNVQVVSGELRLSGGGDLTSDDVLDQFGTVSFSNNDGSANWVADWIDSEGDGPSAGNVQVTSGEMRISNLSTPTTSTVRDEFTTQSYSNNDGTATWATDWIDSEADGPTAGNVQVTGGQLRLNTGSTPAGYVQLTYDDFEVDFGNYTDGGADCALYTGGTFAHQGNNAADIQDNSGEASSFWLTTPIDVDTPGYTEVRVQFWYRAEGMGTGHTFLLEYYNGTAWQTVKTYAYDTDFVNGQFYSDSVVISEGAYTFPTNMQIRFQCVAAGNNEDVYIDEIRVEAWDPGGPGTPPDVAREADLSGGITSANLTFDYSSANAEAGDDVVVEVSNDGGGSYTPLETIAGGGTGSKNYDILTYAAVDTRVRFRISSGYDAGDEYFYVDNVQIEYVTPPGGTPPSVAREADLTGATSATFTFDYSSANAEAGDDIIVEVSDNGGGSYTPLETIAGGGTGSKSYPITAYAAVDTRIRFRVSTGYDVSGEYFSVDNVRIQYDAAGPAATPSVAREVDLSGGITSATFTFDYRSVNAEAGDDLIVEVSDGAGFSTLETISGTGTGSKSYDILAYAAVNTQIRFRVSTGFDVFDEYFYVDNVQVEYVTPGTGAGDSFHVSDGTGDEIVTDGDCIVCHDQSSHQSLAGPTVKLNDPDGGAAITYTGTGGSIEAFCVNCHDGDAGTPFSDGKTPTNIEAGWVSSSHKTALTTEACMSCHGGADSTRTGEAYDRNAHGSSSTLSILSPTIGGETPANAEEALCYACHDSDGPAGTDIETVFTTTTTHHPVADADQSGTGRDTECATCHSPHAAQASVAGRNSNAASGGIVGVSGVNAAGTFVDTISFEYELCFKCHSDYAGGSNPGDGGPDTINKRAQFNTANVSFHSVMGAQNNPYCSPTATNGGIATMEAPWNQTTDAHNTMWCTDCHGGSGGPHGSDTRSMLIAGISAVDAGDGYYTPLCVTCHKYSVYVQGGGGSRFSAHNNANHVAQGNFTKTSTGEVLYGGCLTCHYGGGDNVPMKVEIHGGNNPAGFVTGNCVVSFTFDGSCQAINGDGATCKGHSKGY